MDNHTSRRCFRLARSWKALTATAFVLGCVLALAASSASANIGLTTFGGSIAGPDGSPAVQAGAHPFEIVNEIAWSTEVKPDGRLAPVESLKDLSVDLPLGLVGNPGAAPKCTDEALLSGFFGGCDPRTQIGVMWIESTATPGIRLAVPLFNMTAPIGTPSRFGFVITGVPNFLTARVRASDNGIAIESLRTNQTIPVFLSKAVVWGVPADPRHDGERGSCLGLLGPSGEICPTDVPVKPLLTNSSSCSGGPLTFTVNANSWPDPTVDTKSFVVSDGEGVPAPLTGCGAAPFEASLAMTPDRVASSSPSGFSVKLAMPYLDDAKGLENSPLKTARVVLPKGVTVNPASADGLDACSDEQLRVGLEGPPQCPNASKLGRVTVKSPLLEESIEGAVYLLPQASNEPESGDMYRLAIVLQSDRYGIDIKLPGHLIANKQTGQLTAVFDDSPQLPFETLDLEMKGGPRAPLTTPSACGTHAIAYQLTSWSGKTVEGQSPFTVSENCGASSRFTPGFTAGTVNPIAGQSSPFTLRVTRPDGQQNVQSIQATLPEGVLAKLAGVPLCGEAAAASGNCPAASQLGSATVGAGAGGSPLYVPQPGKAPTAVYLAGPYKGGPYSLIAKVPAQAGPFDLGTVAVRNTISVDPSTAQVSVKSDPLPQILQGIPIAYRDIKVDVDRPDFTLNPTSCDPMQVKGTIGSSAGANADVSSRFQVAGCERLAFKPRLALRLSGAPTRRGGYPKLRAVLRMPKQGANIRRARVLLPKTEFLENAHIRTICTRVQYAAGKGGGEACPKASVYGYAKAWSPLLDKPLQGPVYLRSSNHKLPDLVASLDGQIHVDLVGRIDAVRARIRNTFETVPDAPVSRFVLTMQGGRKGLLVNNTQLCKAKPRASVRFVGQNGKAANSKPLVKVARCGKKRK